MDTLWQDLRFALRALWRTRLVSFIAIASLALAIAGNTTVFSMVNGMLYRRLPYQEPHRLVLIGERPLDLERGQIGGVSPANYLDWKERQQSFTDLAAYRTIPLALTEGEGEPESVLAGAVTDEFFPLLGVSTFFGRVFSAEDCLAGQNRVVVLSHRYWVERFGSRMDAIEPVELNGQKFDVIGILPADFEFLIPDLDFWIPLVMDREEPNRQLRMLLVFGRFESDVTDESAQAEMTAIAARLAEEYPEANRGYTADVLNFRYDIPSGANRMLLHMLQGAMIFILLIACANLANLLLARGHVREHEVAIRASIGASRPHILRHLLAESAIMAVSAGGLGLLLSVFGVRILHNALRGNIPDPYAPIIDSQVLLFSLAVTLVGMLLFGLVPLFQSSRYDLMTVLKSGTSAITTSSNRKRLSKTLVVIEICLSLVLLGGAGVLIRSFQIMQTNDPGFDTENLLTFGIVLPESRYEEEESYMAAAGQLVERLSGLPGVTGVLVSNMRPRIPLPSQDTFTIDSQPVAEGEAMPRISRIDVSPGYFRILGIPLLQGRGFTAGDRLEAAPVAVVNEAMVIRHWGGESPLGRRVTIGGTSREIVGIVGTVHHGLIVNVDFEPIIYLPWAQQPEQGFAVVLKTEVDPRNLNNHVRQEVLSFDPDLAIRDLQTLDEFTQQFFVGQRIYTVILGGFGIMALLLAALGVYGVLAYMVAQQRHEIGIRIAVGARYGNVLRMIASQGLRLLVIGVLLGIPGVVLVTRAISVQISLFVPVQPVAVVAVGVVLTVVVMLASLVPARRAATISPMRALRPE